MCSVDNGLAKGKESDGIMWSWDGVRTSPQDQDLELVLVVQWPMSPPPICAGPPHTTYVGSQGVGYSP